MTDTEAELLKMLRQVTHTGITFDFIRQQWSAELHMPGALATKFRRLLEQYRGQAEAA